MGRMKYNSGLETSVIRRDTEGDPMAKKVSKKSKRSKSPGTKTRSPSPKKASKKQVRKRSKKKSNLSSRKKKPWGSGTKGFDLIGDPPFENPHWRELKERLGDDSRLLQIDPLYALPTDLFDTLREHAPEVLGPDKKVERLLARFCQENGFAGFWRHRPFSYPLLDPQGRGLLNEEHMRAYKRHWPTLQTFGIQEKIKGEFKPGTLVGSRMQAYLGWLVTEPAYRQERDALRQQGEAVVAETADVESFNWIPAAEDIQRLGLPVSDEARSFHESYRQFCRRWCIERLVTWDLPLPTDLVWDVAADAASEDLHAQGVLLFVPYSFIPHGTVNLSDMSSRILHARTPEHLRGWVDRESADRLGQKEDRFGNLYRFHHFWNVILDRYRDRIAGNRTRAKAALGDFLIGPDSVSSAPGTDMANKLFALMRKRLALNVQ